ncbi:helix-turn-helix protein [Amycolatopsis sulphurea]|uniref:Helix-turn-helix protein n=1 Tax=Amycolatopsis sulphurea TaxID=76022 RepID=A0A2A9FH38_9PSEU|nr:helix-turn-helix domain-containing protein [Amycolatopsis sulphurea]PFG50458.1 helix-turn-helix protein [Amycolatopsis sulphurea]
MTGTWVRGVAVMTDVAAVGAELRTARGLSQREVGRSAGLSHSEVSRMDLGSELYSDALVRHLAAYAAALGYTLRFVLVADPPSSDEKSAARGLAREGL